MLESLAVLMADPALPFVTSVNGIILLVIAAFQLVLLIGMAFALAVLVTRNNADSAMTKVQMKAALREFDRERAK